MRKKRLGLLLILVFSLLTMLNIQPARLLAAQADWPILVDNAHLLSKEEARDILNELTETSNQLNINVVVLTIPDAEGQDLDDYVNDFWESNSFAEDSVFLAINMDSQNREILVQGHGICQNYINSSRAQNITDSMVPDMKDENYYDAIRYYISQVETYMNSEPSPNSYSDDDSYDISTEDAKSHNTMRTLAIEVGISMLAATIIVVVIIVNAGGRNTTNCRTYLNPASSRILAKRDVYTHTTTTRHKIQQSSSGKGHGGGGGGGGHSTGRSSF